MPGLVPGIHGLALQHAKNVDGRDKPGHDAASANANSLTSSPSAARSSQPVLAAVPAWSPSPGSAGPGAPALEPVWSDGRRRAWLRQACSDRRTAYPAAAASPAPDPCDLQRGFAQSIPPISRRRPQASSRRS
nr:hypothetical protein FJN17_31475 [Bradyrhizobium symbiodeficiens]